MPRKTKEVDEKTEEEIYREHLERKALEKVDNFAKVTFGYSKAFIMPYVDAITLMKCFINAECYNSENYENHTIRPIGKDDSPSLEIISKKLYIDLKMSHLLGTKVEGA